MYPGGWCTRVVREGVIWAPAEVVLGLSLRINVNKVLGPRLLQGPALGTLILIILVQALPQ